MQPILYATTFKHPLSCHHKTLHFGVFLYLLAYILMLVLGSKCVNIFQVRECRLDISGKLYATTWDNAVAAFVKICVWLRWITHSVALLLQTAKFKQLFKNSCFYSRKSTGAHVLTSQPYFCSISGRCERLKELPVGGSFSGEREWPQQHPSLQTDTSSRPRRRATQEEAHHCVQKGLPPHLQLPLLSGAAAGLLLQTVTGGHEDALPQR